MVFQKKYNVKALKHNKEDNKTPAVYIYIYIDSYEENMGYNGIFTVFHCSPNFANQMFKFFIICAFDNQTCSNTCLGETYNVQGVYTHWLTDSGFQWKSHYTRLSRNWTLWIRWKTGNVSNFPNGAGHLTTAVGNAVCCFKLNSQNRVESWCAYYDFNCLT